MVVTLQVSAFPLDTIYGIKPPALRGGSVVTHTCKLGNRYNLFYFLTSHIYRHICLGAAVRSG